LKLHQLSKYKGVLKIIIKEQLGVNPIE